MDNGIFYNWDDLEVGRVDLNHSEKFFDRKHRKHEKLDDINLEFLSIMDNKDTEKNKSKQRNDKENSKSMLQHQSVSSSSEEPNVGSTAPAAPAARTVPHVPSNILKQPLAASNYHVFTKAKCAGPGPSLLRYTELYEKKRKNMIQQMLEIERKNRIFRSKPAPNFAALAPKLKKPTNICENVTIPITPVVLKKSIETQERRRRMIEEFKKRNEPLKFVSRNPHVLYEPPFKPQKTEHCIEPHPFNLQVEKRLEERKQYNQQYKHMMEEKKRQEEYERKRREEELVREIRKNTAFKARPNPFK